MLNEKNLTILMCFFEHIEFRKKLLKNGKKLTFRGEKNWQNYALKLWFIERLLILLNVKKLIHLQVSIGKHITIWNIIYYILFYCCNFSFLCDLQN